VTGVWGVAAAVAACSPALPSVAARAVPGWNLAALARLAVTAVPLALIDMAVHCLCDKVNAGAFASRSPC
jgi:hypothetical protein